MPTKVRISGEESLTRSVKVENLRFATEKLGSYLGLTHVSVVISSNGVNNCGQCRPASHTDAYEVILRDNVIRESAKNRGRTYRVEYARVLTHELIHLRQFVMGGGPNLSDKLLEAEANALERVYYSVALECLRAAN